ncbi:MAG TPA: SDR family oxidoreductase [Tepidisphaeraceae bacterium]|jgi:NADP-dependent 3-hydroxy acid dehydrogenase YdfG|nr:SDR family oxidoreductase [Tepidisphaeraceae bacterium]
MHQSAIVTGAGTGVGRATALALAATGWSVALLGRTESTLRETRDSAPRPDEMLVLPCDVADAAAVERATQSARLHFGRIDALVCSAGTNTAKRSWADTSNADFELVMNANLGGVYHAVRAVLPTMREQKSGTVVAIASIASLRGMAQPGVAYTASKFGVRGLMQSLNSEERPHGIRACAIFPGEINTPLLDRRAVPPPAEHRAKIIQPEDVAACVMLAVNLPPRAVIEELTIMPR